MKHRAGGKFTSSHSTVIPEATRVLDRANKHDGVTKVSIGMIEHAKSRQPRLKFDDVPAGFKMTVYGRITLQHFVVYTNDRHNVISALKDHFDR